MSYDVYLDQNVISDLRNRKIQAMDVIKAHKMTRLFELLGLHETKVIYSHVTLSEIYQIDKEQYKQEHIELLNSLQAVYIDPLTGEYSDKDVVNVWQDYVAIMQENVASGLDDIEAVNRTLLRKVYGLNVPETFEEIYSKISYELGKIVDKEQSFLESFDFSSLEPEFQSRYLNRESDLNSLKLKISNLKALDIPKEITPDPKVFRELPEVKKLELETIPVKDVVERLEFFITSEHGGSDFLDRFSSTEQGVISRAYSLMNWAGYHADDFLSTKKKFGDRLHASMKDMSHVSAAICADVIVTEDKGMLRKAPACYLYMNKCVRVCTVDGFLAIQYKGHPS
tara:strand:+ start:66 stop:1085 length:1020 start_codon:yes stop_codon:yes gene_type:complete